VLQRISNFTEMGTNFFDNYTAYSWTDGTPTAGANGTRTGIYILGMTNGFTLTAPADTSRQDLQGLCRLVRAQGTFRHT